MAQTSTIARGGGDSSAPARRRQKAPRRGRGLPDWAIPYAFLLPGLLVIAVLLLYPLYQMIDMSFHKVGLRQIRPNPQPAEFLGLQNYTDVFKSDLFWTSLRNTVVFAAVTVALTLLLGTLVGLLLHRLGKKMSTFLIIGIMAAWATPPTATAIIWKWLFDSDAGVANWALNQLPDWLSNALFGRSDWSGQPWLNEPFTIYLVLVVAVVWASFPFIAVSVLAGLKAIPSELYEAARVDGSSPLRTFRKITFPLLKPVFSVLLVLSIIWDFKVFTHLYVLAGGTTNREAFNLPIWAYTEAFSAPPKMGFGAAISVILTVIMLIITAVYVRQIVRTEDL
ncbi:sugar ABC transporter permease [Sphaerisporangium krabiense]|uniref:N,N'-diacetylchitobiose transport system permease protein n=1 Tax=Sphaerisporangium krabiense TaxID=763782 RepID=A0A7W8Z722_9ACTN|nr:sugar ABC transporter permease [Sphaerisporangium krabiense]MBB5628668.1 N,N'-diacetylchitobiose transport system permease protein [Sphaerisporangium krabiense]GII60491.1 sugar ABC transporter permease [Sphaerisporangium krabiense]